MTASQLKQWRLDMGQSQPSMARLLAVPLSTYRNWEQGHRGIPTGSSHYLDLMSWLYFEQFDVFNNYAGSR